jgi:lipopolysaccharide export system protein LptA
MYQKMNKIFQVNLGLTEQANKAGCWLILGLLLSVCAVQAAPDDRKQPIQLSADSVSMDEGRRVSLYRGQVDLRQGSLRVLADQVKVHHDKQNKPIKLVALGKPARFQQGVGAELVKASAQHAEYTVRSAQLTLIGEAMLIQAGDTIKSDRIVYNRQQQILRAGNAAEGKQRVQITLQAPE